MAKPVRVKIDAVYWIQITEEPRGRVPANEFSASVQIVYVRTKDKRKLMIIALEDRAEVSATAETVKQKTLDVLCPVFLL